MHYFKYTIGALVGAACVYWLFHGTDWRTILSNLSNADLGMLVLGFAFMAISQVSRAIRWHIIVNKSFNAEFGSVFKAAQIGLMFNFIIPARLGEIIRSYLLARSNNASIAQSFSTIIVDKSLDLLMMLIALIILSFFITAHGEISLPAIATDTQTPITLSHEIIRYGFTLISLILLSTFGLLILLYTREEHAIRLLHRVLFFMPARWLNKVENITKQIGDGLHILGSKKSLLSSILWSLLIWFFSFLAIKFTISSLLDDVPLMTPFVILVFVAVFIAIPVVPGVIGQYHVAVVTGLLFFFPEMPRETLGATALMTHFVTLAVVVLLGTGAMLGVRMPSLEKIKSLSSNNSA